MGRKIAFFVLGIAVLTPAVYRFSGQDYLDLLIRSYIHIPQRAPEPETYSGYVTQLIATDPLLISISNFLSPHEANHLVALGTPLFQRSMISGGKLTSRRTSDSCFLPGNDTVVSLIKQRAKEFLGGVPYDGIEAVQLVRYVEGQKVDLHFDWHQNQLPVARKTGKMYNRLASFFIYVVADCTGGETWFPNVTISTTFQKGGSATVRTLDDDKGVALKARAGSGVFWMNLTNGTVGNTKTLHAGLPVKSGIKIGMNIWIMKTVS
jgi:prolyl 4-hydroxylase